MSAVPQHQTTADEFLAWAEGLKKLPGCPIVIETPATGQDWMNIGSKLSAFSNAPSIRHYVVVDPEGPLVIHHEKIDDRKWATRFYSGSSSVQSGKV